MGFSLFSAVEDTEKIRRKKQIKPARLAAKAFFLPRYGFFHMGLILSHKCLFLKPRVESKLYETVLKNMSRKEQVMKYTSNFLIALCVGIVTAISSCFFDGYIAVGVASASSSAIGLAINQKRLDKHAKTPQIARYASKEEAEEFKKNKK